MLDEPTNDLDIESLELLEEKLQDYPGTLLLVSHDRRFLDNVVTQTLAAEGDGIWRESVGGYSDWLQQRAAREPAEKSAPKAAGARASAGASAAAAGSHPVAEPPPAKTRVKLSYKEVRELAALPDEIESLEREQSELTTRMGEPDYHRRGVPAVREDRQRLEAIEASLALKYARWEDLETRRNLGSHPKL